MRVDDHLNYYADQAPPERIAGCPDWRRVNDREKDYSYIRTCGECWGCRMNKHMGLVGKCLAAAMSSACVIEATLTYADVVDACGEKVSPDGSIFLDYEDVERYIRALRRRGWKVHKFVAGEYGGANGRAHWHILLFFQWSDVLADGWLQDRLNGSNEHEADRRLGWRSCAPAMVSGRLPESEFQSAIDDPNVWYLSNANCHDRSTSTHKEEFRNKCACWPHGVVVYRLVDSPENHDKHMVNRSIRYCAKYFAKDAWKEAKKFWYLDFDALPEWVKQQTRYRPWNRSSDGDKNPWILGNTYADDIISRNLRAYDCDDDVPLEKRLKRNKYGVKVNGGLGSLYFRMLGLLTEKFGESVCGSRKFTCPGVFKKTSQDELHGRSSGRGHNGAISLESGGLRQRPEYRSVTEFSTRLMQFDMGDCSYRAYVVGFNEARELRGDVKATGPGHIWDTSETRVADASDAASGCFGYHFWKKATKSQRAVMSEAWSHMPDSRLVGLVPKRHLAFLVEYETRWGWPEKKRVRAQVEREGKVLDRWSCGARSDLLRTSKGFYVYEKFLPDGRLWWRRLCETVEQFQHALRGDLLPGNARIAQMEKEGFGDLRPLAGFDRRTVRKWVSKACLLPLAL